MIRSRTDTPAFRIALTITALWTTGFGIYGYLAHKAVPPYTASGLYEQDILLCSTVSNFDPQRGFVSGPNPDRFDCEAKVRARHRSFRAEQQNALDLVNAKWALVPSAMLLALVAFGQSLGAMLSRAAGSYAAWVKGAGSR